MPTIKQLFAQWEINHEFGRLNDKGSDHFEDWYGTEVHATLTGNEIKEKYGIDMKKLSEKESIEEAAAKSWNQINRDFTPVNPQAFLLGFKMGYKHKENEVGATSLIIKTVKLLVSPDGLSGVPTHPIDDNEIDTTKPTLALDPPAPGMYSILVYEKPIWQYWDERSDMQKWVDIGEEETYLPVFETKRRIYRRVDDTTIFGCFNK